MDSKYGLDCPKDQSQVDTNIKKQIRVIKSKASSYGFSISMDKQIGQYVVRAVTSGSPASIHDVQVGDIVYEINNHRLKDLNLNEIVCMVQESSEYVVLVTCRPTNLEKNNFKRDPLLMKLFKDTLQPKQEVPIPKKPIKQKHSRILGGISKLFSFKSTFFKANEKIINNLSDNKLQDSLEQDEKSDMLEPSFEIISHSKSTHVSRPPKISPITKFNSSKSPEPRKHLKDAGLKSISESNIDESIDNESSTITIYEHKMVVGPIKELVLNDDATDDWISTKQVELWNLGNNPIDTEYMNDYDEPEIKTNVESYFDKAKRNQSSLRYMRQNRMPLGERIAYVNNL